MAALLQSWHDDPREWIDSTVGIIGLILSFFSIWFAWYALNRSSVELRASATALKETTVASIGKLETVVKEVGQNVAEAKELSEELADSVQKIDDGLLSDLRRDHEKAFDLLLHNAQYADKENSALHSQKMVGTIGGSDGSLIEQPVVGDNMGIRSQTNGGIRPHMSDPVRERVDRAIALMCAGKRKSFKTAQFFKALELSGMRASTDVAAAVSILLDYKHQNKLGWGEQDLTSRTDIEVRNLKYFHLN